MRLDKLLANMGFGSRKDVKSMLKKKQVTVNEVIKRDGSMHVDPSSDVVVVNGEIVHYQKYIYLMLNKAPGYISATEDMREKTVIDLLPANIRHFKPFPVGRLDKDTEGLLLLTNDGELAHQLTSPKKDIEKTYYAKISGTVTDVDVEKFQHGVTLDDGYHTKPAKLNIIQSGKLSEIEVTITEGKFHQVKRMFEAVDKKVVYLKRTKMGELSLDESLAIGSFRELNDAELNYCLSLKK
ncbi:MAG TPA: pseudouridine synthase [Virgibacillus sp.]|nr:pseudouridine synthase [Virgibacillus sp.]